MSWKYQKGTENKKVLYGFISTVYESTMVTKINKFY